jgi:hypothetical protein
MNPYFEHPGWWPAIHTDLIVSLRDTLVPALAETDYYVTIELREYELPLDELMNLELVAIGDVSITHEREPARVPNGSPRIDGAASEREAATGPNVLTVTMPRPVPVRERYLEIRRPQTHDLITVIEILSPTNKMTGRGRRQYEEKRLGIAETLTNLIEIDLLRAGEPLLVLYDLMPLPREMAGDYRVLVSRGGHPRRSQLYPIALRQPLPSIPIPLRSGEEEPHVDLQQVLHTVYDRGAYGRGLNYQAEPAPPLPPDEAAWADRLLRERGLR